MKKQIFKSKGLFWIFPIFLFATHFHTAYGQDYNDLVVTFPYEENLSRLMASQAIDYIRVNKQARDRIENNLKDNGIQLNDFDPKLLRMDYKLVKKLASYTHNAFRISDPDVSEGLRAELRLTNAKLKDEIEAKNGYTFEAAINLKQAMEYNKLQTLELKLDKGQLEIDKIYISTKDQINLP